MVSCQWRLTSGPRVGQACGKGKEVFCKTHAPKAKQELMTTSSWDQPLNEFLKNEMRDAENLLYRGGTVYGRGLVGPRNTTHYDFSKSWIWDPETNDFREEFNVNRHRPYSQRLLNNLANPETIANWLENIFNTSLRRGDEIFPQPIQEDQLNGIGALSLIFQRRMDTGKNLNRFYISEIQNSRWGGPMPFFQNRRYQTPTMSIYNKAFTSWLSRCINYSPDYSALWKWFLPNFTNGMVAQLDAIKQGYDVDAIQQDLKALRNTYRKDLNQSSPTLPDNRYRQR